MRRPLESTQCVLTPLHRAPGCGGHRAPGRQPATSLDNALAETINGLYKAEVIHRRGPWRSFEAVEFATLEWVDSFNHRPLLSPSATCPRLKPKRATTLRGRCLPEPRDPSQNASEKPGAVHTPDRRSRRGQLWICGWAQTGPARDRGRRRDDAGDCFRRGKDR